MESSKITDGEVIGAGIDGAGIDVPKQRRPGVPMETEPQIAKGAHWDSPARQQPHGEILRRPDLAELTPVFGTAQPPHGLSGVIRRYAYTIPDHKPQRWAALLLADRVDVAESGLTDLFRRKPLAVTAGFLLIVGAGVAVAAALRGRRSEIGRALG